MDRITLRDYRCFHGEQTARMAPLTLIVGENSTGKTSFMAMIRALWEVAYNNAIPDFKEEPYDLGSFAEVAHHRGGRAGRADSFYAGFQMVTGRRNPRDSYSFDVTFGQKGTAPVPIMRRISNDALTVTAVQENGSMEATIETAASASWRCEIPNHFGTPDEEALVPLFLISLLSRDARRGDGNAISEEDVDAVRDLLELSFPAPRSPAAFASAPVRSKPRRTYDPARPSRDPEGDYVPMYLAHVYRQNKKEWNVLKARLEDFGKASGLFDELSIKSLGPRESEPFQLQVRKLGKRLKGPPRNLIDVGYGVSQVLPLITEMLRPDAPSIFLLQQPEVHLHPSAQAALGSLFCHVAASDRQLVVETHSDHLINRVRLDLRDRKVPLSPEDVSLLYFEREELEVRIHSLRLDDEGNVRDAPPSYGRYFMEEMERSLKH